MPGVQHPKRGNGPAISEATEKEWQAQVWQLAHVYGWVCWHFHDSRRQFAGQLVGDAAAAGFPDLVMAHPHHGLAFVELKTDRTASKPTAKQRQSLAALAGAAASLDHHGSGRVVVHLWRPRDLATVVIPTLKGARWVPAEHGWEP